jgi:hypothetical protein
MENEMMLLRDSNIEPTNDVLLNELGKDVFDVYFELIKVTLSEFNLQYEWRYYKDGNAWLCKITDKKKTIFWLSAWEKHLKIGFYFTEKTALGIFGLNIDEETKQTFKNAKPIGKLIPLILCLNKMQQLSDFKEITVYKKNLK